MYQVSDDANEDFYDFFSHIQPFQILFRVSPRNLFFYVLSEERNMEDRRT